MLLSTLLNSGRGERRFCAQWPFFTPSLRSFPLFHRITQRDACVCMPFFTLFNVFLRSFPFSTGSHRETLVCARLSLRFSTFFYALFPFPHDHRERERERETLVCARLSLRFSTFFYALFPFRQDHRRDACVCTLFFTLFNVFLTLFSLFHRITERDACWCTPRICWSCRRW